MFTIYDGRDSFYQWDLDRKLIVNDSTIKQVHFCNKTDDCSLVVDTYTEEGLTLANVPNILLQTDWKIRVYGYTGNYTKHEACFKVNARTKPTDYVYTETEVINWEKMQDNIAEEVTKNSVGRYTEEGGTVFNNYATNKAGFEATAFGADTKAYGATSFAAGSKVGRSGAPDDYSEEFKESDWRYTEALAPSSAAIGRGAVAYSIASKSLGYRTQTGYPPNTQELAKRPEAVVQKDANGKTTFPANNIGQAAVALGADTAAVANNSVAMGYKTRAFANQSLATGTSTEARGINAVAMGHTSKALGGSSLAMGINAEANGTASFAIGEKVKANSDYTCAIGRYAEAKNPYSTAIGGYVTASGDCQTVVGRYNLEDSSALFIVGNGNGTERKNAFAVNSNGNATLRGTLTCAPAVTDNDAITKKQLDEKQQILANVLKGAVSGEIVSMTDVSPIAHDINLTLSSDTVKNFSNVKVIKYSSKNYAPTTENTWNGAWTKFQTTEPLKANKKYYVVGDFNSTSNQALCLYSLANGASTRHTYIPLGENVVVELELGGVDALNFYFHAQPAYDSTASNTATISRFAIVEAEPEEYTATANGTVKGIVGNGENMTLTTNNPDVKVNAGYNKDTNKVIENLTNAIISLGGKV